MGILSRTDYSESRFLSYQDPVVDLICGTVLVSRERKGRVTPAILLAWNKAWSSDLLFTCFFLSELHDPVVSSRAEGRSEVLNLSSLT